MPAQKVLDSALQSVNYGLKQAAPNRAARRGNRLGEGLRRRRAAAAAAAAAAQGQADDEAAESEEEEEEEEVRFAFGPP
jgi:hypothetical protein